MDILKAKNDIPKVLLGINVIFLVVGFFFYSKGLLLAVLLVNALFNITHMIVNKYGLVGQMLLDTKKALKPLQALNN